MKCKTIIENIISQNSASAFDEKVNAFLKELDEKGYYVLEQQFQHSRSSLSVSIIYADDLDDL
ncbi:hypothetical protein [Lactococcus petauri]|uniref:hypothetical protein n=1 Tax=Lactococcus petauri TaxID=1940789 RepID=UPI00254E403F|nr:hypothetical protein [Lactococcus petauri]